MTEIIFGLISGSYAYTWLVTKSNAKQSSVDRLQDRVDRIYELLLKMNGNAKEGEK